MTAKLFVWIYDYYFGLLNRLLVALHVVGGPVDWLGDDSTVMGAMITVGIFVSLPFTTYVLLAGLQAIDRKSTRLNSSHSQISYAVFCLKKKKKHSVQNLMSLKAPC